MINRNELISVFNNNLSTTSVGKFMVWLETLSGENVKWKKNTSANQVVLRTDQYYYKVYAFDEIDKFNSIIRHKLAEIYQSYGFYWEIVTVKTETGYIDIEKRQILDVCDEWSDEILLNFSVTLKLLEEKLNFDYILEEVKKQYSNARALKLVRVTLNKPEDYAIYDSKVILLDDADWCIVIIDNDGRTVGMINPLIKIHLEEEDYFFTELLINAKKMMTIDKLNEFSNKFFIFKDVDIIDKVTSLRKESQHQFEDNVNLLLNNSLNEINKENDLLYSHKSIRKTFQFELWQYCSNYCKFCFLGDRERAPQKANQLKSLEELDKSLDTLDYTVYNKIALIGGEFFQGQLDDKDVHDKFISVIKKIINLYIDRKIGAIWITAIMTRENQEHLYEVLDLAKFMGVHPANNYPSSGLWICTSWDTEGRFHIPSMRENWEKHMIYISKHYPEVNKITNILLQQSFIDLYLNDGFNPKEFMDKYKTTLFYNCCAIPGIHNVKHYKMFENMNTNDIDNILMEYKTNCQRNKGIELFPRRTDFIRFLHKYYSEDRDTYDRLFNMKYKPDDKYKHFENEQINVKMNIKHNFSVEGYSVPTFTCGHNKLNFAPYIDSNKCALCDKLIVGDMI